LKLKITCFPAGAEIYNIIKDHRLLILILSGEEFLRVNEGTLRYDLKKLQNANLIKKRVYQRSIYEPIKNSTTSPSFTS